MARNFDNIYTAKLVGLWDFRDEKEVDDTGLDDGIAQDGNLVGDAWTTAGWLLTDGEKDRFEVPGNGGSDNDHDEHGDHDEHDDHDEHNDHDEHDEHGQQNGASAGDSDDPFDLSEGTIIAEFKQAEPVGSDPDTIVSRGIADQALTDGFFEIRVTAEGAVQAYQATPDGESLLSTEGGFFAEGDIVKVTYTWSATEGPRMLAENLTQGTSENLFGSTLGLTMEFDTGDGNSFVIAAQESSQGDFGQNFKGAIDYVAVLDEPVKLGTGDGVVDGTAGDDVIDLAYTGDPEGDMIDNGDAILPGEGPDDDIVDAGAGDDEIMAGLGDDTVYAGSGSDTVYGEAGDDVIWGDSNAPDGGGTASRESFEWDLAPDPDDGGEIDNGDDLSGGFTQDTGSVEVTYSVVQESSGVDTEFTTEKMMVDGIDTDGGPADHHSSLKSVLNGQDNSATYQLDFSSLVTDVSFRINDIDGDGVVQVLAFGEDGQPIPVVLSGGARVTLSDEDSVPGNDTADSNGGYADSDNPKYSVLVTVPGPVAQLQILHDQDGSSNTGIQVTDVYFDVPVVDPGADGDDVLDGGAGDDIIYGEGGDDTITGGDGSDTVYGGDGDDVIDTSGSDALPDRGFPSYNGLPAVPADPDIYDDRDVVDGGAGDDTIITGDDEDIITGGAGDDTIDGGLDDDDIDGGAGDDFIVGGEGSDTILGGDGDDTIYGGLDPSFPDFLNIRDDGTDGPADPVTDNGMDVIDGGAGDDIIYGQDDDDTITGGEGDDYIDGGIDNDTLSGDAGDDTLIGGQGADTISGGDDRDTIIGGDDGDVVDGGTGGDDYDILDLTGVNFNITSRTVDPDGDSTSGTIDLLDGGGNVTGSMTFAEIEEIVPCFTPGTLIATPRGEVRVEDLRIGDRVITRDNGIQDIRWVGARELSGQELASAAHLNPILIREGALGNGLPERDMMVSPNHRMLVANDKTALYFEDREVLVAAKHLTGLEGVDRVEVSGVTYIHFMFAQHEVVLSDGTWTESFQPGDLSLKGIGNAQRNEILELFPALKTREGLNAFSAARRSLKKHEARLLM